MRWRLAFVAVSIIAWRSTMMWLRADRDARDWRKIAKNYRQKVDELTRRAP